MRILILWKPQLSKTIWLTIKTLIQWKPRQTKTVWIIMKTLIQWKPRQSNSTALAKLMIFLLYPQESLITASCLLLSMSVAILIILKISSIWKARRTLILNLPVMIRRRKTKTFKLSKKTCLLPLNKLCSWNATACAKSKTAED